MKRRIWLGTFIIVSVVVVILLIAMFWEGKDKKSDTKDEPIKSEEVAKTEEQEETEDIYEDREEEITSSYSLSKEEIKEILLANQTTYANDVLDINIFIKFVH